MPNRIPSSPEPALNGAAKRVLIVEDEPIVAFALEDMLEELGHVALGVAGDIEQALPMIGEGPDLVILDVNLRGNKSYPLADWLKEQGISYIFATGYGDSEHPEQHRAVPTLTKPYSKSGLKAALDLCA